LDFPGVVCMTGFISFRNRLIYTTMLLPAAAAILAVPPLILKASLFFKWQKKNLNEAYKESVGLFFSSLLFVIFLCYPTVSRITFSALSCANLGSDGNFMRSDFRQGCPGDSSFERIWSIVMIILIPVGCPAFMLSMLYYHKVPSLVAKKHRNGLMRALFEDFRSTIDVNLVERLFAECSNINVGSEDEVASLQFRSQETSSSEIQLLLRYTHPSTTHPEADWISSVKQHKKALDESILNTKERIHMPSKEVCLVLWVFAYDKLLDHERHTKGQTSEMLHILSDSDKMAAKALEKLVAAYAKLQECSAVKLYDKLLKLAAEMEKQGCLTVPSLKWNTSADCQDKDEKIAIARLGFLFLVCFQMLSQLKACDMMLLVFISS